MKKSPLWCDKSKTNTALWLDHKTHALLSGALDKEGVLPSPPTPLCLASPSQGEAWLAD